MILLIYITLSNDINSRHNLVFISFLFLHFTSVNTKHIQSWKLFILKYIIRWRKGLSSVSLGTLCILGSIGRKGLSPVSLGTLCILGSIGRKGLSSVSLGTLCVYTR